MLPLLGARPLARRVLLLAVLVAGCSNAGSTGAGATPARTASVGSSGAPAASSASFGPETSGPASGAIEACDLLTVDEVAVATGVKPVTPIETDAIAGQFSCAYTAADGTPIAEDTVITPASPISPRTTYDGFAAGAEAFTGIGDRAIWAALLGTEAGSL
jgi:hypothetical protein